MKIPLAFSLKNRDSSLAKDAKLVNGYVETRGDPKKGGIRYVEKRPALDSAFELTSGSGQALYVTNIPGGDGSPSEDVLGTVIGDILTRAPTPKTKRLRVGVQPSAVALNTSISPSVTVTIRDSLGNVVNSSANVTVALDTNPTGATLGGTLTVAAVAGTATFSNLTLNRSGSNFTLVATSVGLNSVVSNPFTISTQLAFTTQPAATTTGATMAAVVVTARDSASATDTNYNGVVVLSIYSRTAAGILSGTLSVNAVSGVATFSTLSIDVNGTYDLFARAEAVSTAYTPSSAVSSSFQIAAYILTSALLDPNIYGYSDGGGGYGSAGGAITPTTFNSVTIKGLVSLTTGAGTTVFVLEGSRAATFFASITFGATTILAATALHEVIGGIYTQWTWSSQQFITTTGTFSIDVV